MARVQRGFTLIEALVVVIILGVLAAVIAPRLLKHVGQSKRAVAQANVATLMGDMQRFAMDREGSLDPGTTLSVLLDRPSDMSESQWKGPYVNNPDELRDPWGNSYVLVVPGQFNVDFDVVSYGADGAPGGEGDNADIVAGKKE